MSNLRRQYEGVGLSDEAMKLIYDSWAPGTRKRYESYINRWKHFCAQRNISWDATRVEDCVNFLAGLRASGLGYSAVNTARSALSAVVSLEDGSKVGTHPLIVRLLKGVFKVAPSKPRYAETWDPNVVLNFIQQSTVGDLSLQDLSQRTAMLVLLCSGQRTQTLAQLTADNVVLSDEKCVFSIGGLLKTSRPGHVQDKLVLKSFESNKSICVVNYVREYRSRRDNMNLPQGTENNNFFVSHRPPHKPVTASTIARWVLGVMKQSGINVDIFKAHSTRSAGTSAARGLVPLDVILASGGWSSQCTFAKFYEREVPRQRSLGDAIASRLHENL